MNAARSTTRGNRSSLLTPLIVIATLVTGILTVATFHPAGAQSCSLMGPTMCSNMQCSATVYNSDFMHGGMCTLTMATGANCMPTATTLNRLSSVFLVGTGTTVTNPRCAVAPLTVSWTWT